MTPVFIVFESRYTNLSAYLNGDTSGQLIMGEVKWFYSLIKHLLDNNIIVIHCKDEEMFLNEYLKYNKNVPIRLIMDYRTIPLTIAHLEDSIDYIYCMCYWGRDADSIKELGNVNNKAVLLKNVLTPFDYYTDNRYLGYDTTYLCKASNTPTNRQFSNIGVLWGKTSQHINVELVTFLTSKGLHFYSTSNEALQIEGVTNLGILETDTWFKLLTDSKYVLSFGNPPSGPTILEALYYKNVLFGPSCQYPKSTHNTNIKFTDNLSYEQIYTLIVTNEEFIENDDVCNSLLTPQSFNTRVAEIFL